MILNFITGIIRISLFICVCVMAVRLKNIRDCEQVSTLIKIADIFSKDAEVTFKNIKTRVINIKFKETGDKSIAIKVDSSWGIEAIYSYIGKVLFNCPVTECSII